MPVRAHTAHTKAAFQSVLRQSHRNLELVLVGNDDVDELLAQLPNDPRVTGISRKAPGIISALNTGINACTGDFIARMDADDLSHPDRLKTQLAFARSNPHIGLIGACVEIFSDDAEIGQGNQRYQHWLNSVQTSEEIASACLIESPMPHPSLFAHHTFWSAIGPYRERGWPEDYDLILRSWLARIAMAKPAPVLLKWREHPQRLTHTDKRYSREAFIKAKAWAITQAESGLGLHKSRTVWICGTGRNARYWHDALVDNKAEVLGFVELNSAKPKTQKRHLPVITYQQLLEKKSDSLIVSAISNPDARLTLVKWFERHKLRGGVDYVLGG